MIALTLYLLSLASPTAPPPCQQVGPRLDGTTVTICQGTVVAVRDDLGNTREWNASRKTITVRAPGARPLVLGALR
jgi:hypothetical protein